MYVSYVSMNDIHRLHWQSDKKRSHWSHVCRRNHLYVYHRYRTILYWCSDAGRQGALYLPGIWTKSEVNANR